MQEILLLRKTLPSRSSQNIHQRKYLCEVIHTQSSILYLSEGQNSGCQMSGSVIHIYKERLLIQWFAQEFSTIGFLYLSKGLEFRLSGDGDYDSSHYKVFFIVYLGFNVAFNTVQVISRRVVGRAEETST